MPTRLPVAPLAGVAVLSGVLALLAGCYATQTATSPYSQPVYTTAVGQPVYGGSYGPDDYVYYPGAEVYYNTSRHEYVYPRNGRWVRQTQAPRISVWGPSVHLTLRDGPEHHHDQIRREYPRNWHPGPGSDRRDWDHDHR